jgi:hypothetical protein
MHRNSGKPQPEPEGPGLRRPPGERVGDDLRHEGVDGLGGRFGVVHEVWRRKAPGQNFAAAHACPRRRLGFCASFSLRHALGVGGLKM